MPACGPEEVRIRVAACGVNYPDALLIADKYQSKPERPFIPGGEVAGIIDELGGEVVGLEVGDRVLAFVGQGGFAEAIVCSAKLVMRIPDIMPLVEASRVFLQPMALPTTPCGSKVVQVLERACWYSARQAG